MHDRPAATERLCLPGATRLSKGASKTIRFVLTTALPGAHPEMGSFREPYWQRPAIAGL
jgi:hypothetical protein